MTNSHNYTQSNVLENTEKFAKKTLNGEGTGHDWWHIERVRNNARLINKTENADPLIVELATLLHDVGDRKVLGTDEDDHTIAEDFLKSQKLEDEKIGYVMHIIKNMSFSKTLGCRDSSATIEFQVVQDADRLDAIGAIGIARAFAFGGSRSRPLYDPTKQAQTAQTTEEYRKNEGSTFHHFEEKLLKLKDLMNTETGKNIAQERHKFMEDYLFRFLDEWNGKR